MKKRVFSLVLCALLLTAGQAVGAEPAAVSVGAAPDDYVLVNTRGLTADMASLRLNGFPYRPQGAETDGIRVNREDLAAVAAIKADPALLADTGLTQNDIVLSRGKLSAGDASSSQWADIQAGVAVSPSTADYIDALTKIAALQRNVCTTLQGEAFAASADVQGPLGELEQLAATAEALLRTLSALEKYAALAATEEARQQAEENILLYVRSRLSDTARDTLVWLNANADTSGGAEGGQAASETNAFRAALARSDTTVALRGLLEAATEQRISNRNAVQVKAEQANRAIAGAGADLSQTGFTLTDGGALNVSFTVEAAVQPSAPSPWKPSKTLAQLTNPLDGVKRLGLADRQAAAEAPNASNAPIADYGAVALGSRGFPVLGEPLPGPETFDAGPNARLYKKNKLTLSLDTVQYTLGTSLSLTVTLNNESKAPATVCVTGVVLDGLLFPLNADQPATAEAGQSVALSAATSASAAYVLALAGNALPKEMRVEYLLLAGSKTIQAVSEPVSLFDSDGLAAAFAQTEAPVFEDNRLRAYVLAFYPRYGKALLLLEATKGASWESVAADAVYDGNRALGSQTFRLQAGMKAACLLSVAEDCPWLGLSGVNGIQVYLTFRHGNKQRAPSLIVLGAPTAADAPDESAPDESAPIWIAGECSTRFLGVSQDCFADGDALLFEVENATEGTVYLLCAGGYLFLDGQRMETDEYAAACYPGTISRVAFAPTEGLSLAAYREAELRLALYGQEGWHLRENVRSPGLTVALK